MILVFFIDVKLEMAHAIRLNLRMQKELKLLISDPPPGVSLVPNSDDGCSTSSLSKIEARKFPTLSNSYVYYWKHEIDIVGTAFIAMQQLIGTNAVTGIKGPEGTVYDKGIFHVRVQIPERCFSLFKFIFFFSIRDFVSQ